MTRRGPGAAHGEVPVESYGFLELDGDRVTRIIETKDDGRHRPRASCVRSTPASTRRARRGSGRTSRGSRRRRTASATSRSSRRWRTTKATPAIAVDRRRSRSRCAASTTASSSPRPRRRCATASAAAHMLAGVTIIDPADDVHRRRRHDRRGHDDRAADTHLRGATTIGSDCTHRPGHRTSATRRIGDALRRSATR